jgi:hypothetical protein
MLMTTWNGNWTSYAGDLVKRIGLFFRKVGHSTYDVTAEMLYVKLFYAKLQSV